MWEIWGKFTSTWSCSITWRLAIAVVFLEHIPHLRKHFVYPAVVENGKYVTAQEPGLSCDLIPGSR